MIARYLMSVCLAAALIACGDTSDSPEDAVRAWIAKGEIAVEEKNRSELLDMISDGYADARGNDREQLGDLLRLYFFRQNNIALITSVESIELLGNTAATVMVTIGMAGTQNSALGISADAYKFEFEMTRPDDEWLLIGARWAELGKDLR